VIVIIIDYLDAVLGEGKPHTTSKGVQYSYQCPICGDWKDRLFVHPDRKVVFCHNCEYANSVITFISDMSNITWKEALNIYREYDGYDVKLPDSLQEEIYARLSSAPEIIKEKYVYPLPEEFILVEEAKGETGKKVIEYLKSRGVSMETAQKQYIGYCAEGEYADRIIMPDFEDYEIVYWQARTILPTPKSKILKKMFRKAMNPSLTKEQIEQGIVAVDKSEVISNIDYIRESGVAVICEGRMDSYTIGDNGACIHGKHMSDHQLIKLVQNKDKIETIAIMLDGDAFDSALILADRLYKHFDNILMTKLPYGEDPNSIGTKGVLEHLVGAIPYSPMFSVKARLRGWI
jgi:DNA primase